MATFDLLEGLSIPSLPVVDLVTRRPGSKQEQVTADHVYFAQYNWRLGKLYRLDPDRRKELCTLLVSLVKKLAPELKGSDAMQTWEKVAKDPTYPDKVFDVGDME